MKELMDIFVDFGKMKDLDPASEEAQTQVKFLQDYITEHFYNCTKLDKLNGATQSQMFTF